MSEYVNKMKNADRERLSRFLRKCKSRNPAFRKGAIAAWNVRNKTVNFLYEAIDVSSASEDALSKEINVQRDLIERIKESFEYPTAPWVEVVDSVLKEIAEYKQTPFSKPMELSQQSDALRYLHANGYQTSKQLAIFAEGCDVQERNYSFFANDLSRYIVALDLVRSYGGFYPALHAATHAFSRASAESIKLNNAIKLYLSCELSKVDESLHKAYEFWREYGEKEAIHLIGLLERQDADTEQIKIIDGVWFKTSLGFTVHDLKRLVDSHELVNQWDGVERLKSIDLDVAKAPYRSFAAKACLAIYDFEQCNQDVLSHG